MESNKEKEGCGRHTQGEGSSQACTVRRTPRTAHTPIHGSRHTHTALPQHQHTDGRGKSKQERHTRLHRMQIRQERSVVSAPLTEGTHTHIQEGAAHTATQQQSNKKENPRTPRGLLVHGKRSQYSSQKQFSRLWPSFIFSAHHFMQARPPPQLQPHTQK
ncbi:hypothetical protein TcCL_Unassigned01807 [Trypanosoma cruzi]|nr:hypothetical protein TcCL_Unassigned01807 [Trypanosoma cruzi]